MHVLLLATNLFQPLTTDVLCSCVSPAHTHSLLLHQRNCFSDALFYNRGARPDTFGRFLPSFTPWKWTSPLGYRNFRTFRYLGATAEVCWRLFGVKYVSPETRTLGLASDGEAASQNDGWRANS